MLAIDSWMVSPSLMGYSSQWMSRKNLRSSRKPVMRETRSYFCWSTSVMTKVESRRSESALQNQYIARGVYWEENSRHGGCGGGAIGVRGWIAVEESVAAKFTSSASANVGAKPYAAHAHSPSLRLHPTEANHQNDHKTKTAALSSLLSALPPP